MTKTITMVRFTSEASRTGSTIFIVVTKDASARLPSKGMNTVEGIINGRPFISTLEPDGNGGHRLWMDKEFRDSVGVKAGDKVTLEFVPVKVEPEPKIPTDLKKALEADSEAALLWQDITALARRDWVHWIISAKQTATRARRIEQTCTKLKDGKRRPCCFNYQCAVVAHEPEELKG